MEDLPEFKAVVSFLESYDVDIEYFIESINDFLGNLDRVQRRILRNPLKQLSGRDPSAFIRDRMELFPKEKMTALYEKKLAEDEGFQYAMESFFSVEWNEIYIAIWQNNAFLNEVSSLKENGIDVALMLFMKFAITFLALVALSYAAPQPRKLFHEHFEDFTDVIVEEVGQELNELMEQYLQFDEFLVSLNYLVTPNFRNLVYEMEDLPEFKAVVEFLEGHEIDIQFFIDTVNTFVDGVARRSLRQSVSGRDFTAFMQDSIAIFPNEKLVALYDEKVAEDEAFRLAMESFYSDEWNEIYNALWENETFLNEVATLKENGIDVEVLLLEARAVLGLQ
ncbi:uncharacterized protein LOC123662493 [Melitaea cinxia]|uniref:uncharacterized protein LOC123662493 n=1 Tax=Melitaea cinxia TaxID=113334 RepID=UPI001E270239|nr:uncharacterized protein LOC123662493 [Melitaea cinxia]